MRVSNLKFINLCHARIVRRGRMLARPIARTAASTIDRSGTRATVNGAGTQMTTTSAESSTPASVVAR